MNKKRIEYRLHKYMAADGKLRYQVFILNKFWIFEWWVEAVKIYESIFSFRPHCHTEEEADKWVIDNCKFNPTDTVFIKHPTTERIQIKK